MTIGEIAAAFSLTACLIIAGSAVTMLGIYWCHPQGWMKRRGKP